MQEKDAGTTCSAGTWPATPSPTVTTGRGADGQPKVRQITPYLACRVGSITSIIITIVIITIVIITEV